MSNINIFQFISSLFSKNKAAEKPVSDEMQVALDTWLEMYQYGGSTENNSRSLDLPAAIASEFVRLVMAESELQVDGENQRSVYLNEQLQRFFRIFSAYRAEIAFSLGSMVFKPYVSGNRVLVDMVRADRYVPTAFDDAGDATSAVFMTRKVIGMHYYTRLETHIWDADTLTYTVENKAYCSLSDDALGNPYPLSSVPGWEHLEECQSIANIEKPLFAVFRMPYANNIDPDSPIGVSCYARAAELIHEANAQWARIQWEYKGTELAVDAAEDLFKKDKSTKERLDLPIGSKRLFRRYAVRDKILSQSIETFSPAIRDESLFNGLNHIFQRIEFNVGLAYGTLSSPTDIEKTAEEIRTSRQRSYVQVCKMQKSLQDALEHLIYAMDVYTTLYSLSPMAYDTPTLTCSWGDSVLEDTDKEFQRRLQMVTAGKLKPENLLSWYFGCTEDEAKEYMPDLTDDGGLFGGGGF